MFFKKNSHRYPLLGKRPSAKYPKGFRIDANGKGFPVLKGMGISYLKLHQGGMREPHWHPNAHELNYCLSGKALLTLFGPANRHETFELNPGQISFVPMGTLHHVENLGEGDLEMLVCFSDPNFEDLSLSAGVSAMPPEVMSAVFQTPSAFFEKIPKTENGVFISQQISKPLLSLAELTNPFKYPLEEKNPEVRNRGGEVRMSNQTLFPALDSLTVYSLYLEKGGVREPHWHPNANELNYLIEGSVRITLMSPGGIVETFDMKKGDISFMPRGYFHMIENIQEPQVHMAIFFDNVYPSDIGISGSLGAYSNEVLASILGVKVDDVDSLPKYQEDLLVVPKNP